MSSPHRTNSPSRSSGMCQMCGLKPAASGLPCCGPLCAQKLLSKRSPPSGPVPDPSVPPSIGSTPMCPVCHASPCAPGFQTCSRKCAATISGPTTNANTGFPSSAAMCQVCHVKPVYPGHNYCGRTCANKRQTVSPNVPSTSYPTQGNSSGAGGISAVCKMCQSHIATPGLPCCSKTCASKLQQLGTSPPMPSTGSHMNQIQPSTTYPVPMCAMCGKVPATPGFSCCSRICGVELNQLLKNSTPSHTTSQQQLPAHSSSYSAARPSQLHSSQGGGATGKANARPSWNSSPLITQPPARSYKSQ